MRKMGMGLLVWLGLEILLMRLVGQYLGGWTLAALLLTGVLLGRQLIRGQSIASLNALRQSRQPAAASLLRLLAGMLLILPGFLSDALALLCLFPATGRWLQGKISAGFMAHGAAGFSHAAGKVFEGELEPDAAKPSLPAHKGQG